MIIYYAIILLTFALSYIEQQRKIDYAVFTILAIFFSFSYMTGSDWRNYEQYYYTDFAVRHVEPGYMLLSNTFHKIGVSFWWFHCGIKFICFYLLWDFLKRYQENIYMALTLLISSYCLYLFIDCPFRSLIAISIFLYSTRFIEEKKPLLYILGGCLASSMHLTAIITLPLYWITQQRFSTKILFIVYSILFLYLAFFNITDIFLPIKTINFDLYNRLAYYLNNANSETSIFTPSLLIRILVLFYMLAFKESLIKYWRDKEWIYNMAFIYLILNLVAYKMNVLQRFSFFPLPFYILIICSIIDIHINTSRNIMKMIFLVIALYTGYSWLIKPNCYIPYSSYLLYWIQQNEPKFEIRTNYNHNGLNVEELY
ncbi:MAG: EpsG family protein [Marinifilaceae bacterium]